MVDSVETYFQEKSEKFFNLEHWLLFDIYYIVVQLSITGSYLFVQTVLRQRVLIATKLEFLSSVRKKQQACKAMLC